MCRSRLLSLFLVCLLATLNPLRVSAQDEGDTDFTPFGIYAQTAPRAEKVQPTTTKLPLQLRSGSRIALIGNTLFERAQLFGVFESMLHQRFPEQQLIVRNLAWSADEVDLQPRPDNFADLEQHLTHERADVVLVAFGFNESFAGIAGLDGFQRSLSEFVLKLRSSAFNGETGPQVVLVSPIANENVTAVAAADRNNEQIALYVNAMRQVAAEQQVGFIDVFDATRAAMQDPGSDLTFNGCHLNRAGYDLFAKSLYRGLLAETPPLITESLRNAVTDKSRLYFRRYRPVNTFYYTGGRNKAYGYLDFLPAMRNFDLMVANRDQQVWQLAQDATVSAPVDDSNVPELPQALESRGANRWMTAADELAAFQVDPRFDVTLFAGEEEFPELGAPIQMRWDRLGRLWVSCSTTYPHVYPGNEPNDKLVILEDTDGDGRADRSSVFAEDLHIPLSFEFGDGGVYVSEMPYLTFLKDTDGDGRADFRQRLLAGFGTEDSHHALHDFVWTPDGDLLFRESIFHHSQVETPYGPVRQQNSGWFRFQPRTQRLTSFGTYHSTNPWGVTFDDWGQHVASHPIYAAAFHSLDPEYPRQHPRPRGLRAYSGVCGQEFVDFGTFPESMQGNFIKVRYKPTNRVEIHRWKELPFGYDEEYVGDLIFSQNLSFIPVDIRFGPRGALYICDWYNPIKGHAQYSLRDDRRDRHSGRIWRVTTKGMPLQDPPRIADATVSELVALLARPEYRYRYWAKRELRERSAPEVARELEAWHAKLDSADPRFRHHQLEALWAYRWIGEVRAELLRELLACDEYRARAAAARQLRHWHSRLDDTPELLRRLANDPHSVVRMEAAIAASYVGTQEALDAILDVFQHPMEGHLAYAVRCSLGSHTLRRHWEGNPDYDLARRLHEANRENELREPTPGASEAQFDSNADLKKVEISCEPERMLFTVKQFEVRPRQPVKLVFTNPDATDHNLILVRPGALAEVGMAANEMAKDRRFANSNFRPPSKKHLILHGTPMIGPTRRSRVAVLRFEAPREPGVYPYVCTFPGHWVVMNGVMVVASTEEEKQSLLAATRPKIVRQWTLADFSEVTIPSDEHAVTRGMQAFMKAQCHQCHQIAGHGVNLGPDLVKSIETLRGKRLLQQVLEPSSEIHKEYRTYQFLLASGRIATGVIVKEDSESFHLLANLLTPDVITQIPKRDVDEQIASRISSMPEGLLNVLTRAEILDLLAFLEAGPSAMPAHH